MTSSLRTRTKCAALIGAAVFSVSLGLGAGQASAQTVSGWTGITVPNDSGYTFLHNSTIINSPKPVAEVALWTVTGNNVPPGEMGTRARLFKSGILCEAIDYTYNTTEVAKQTGRTSGLDCGSGSYNSHGFINVWDNTTGYREYVTFPTNPLNWNSPTARATAVQPSEPSGVNGQGQSFGSGEAAKSDSELPDLVAAYATNGAVGYIRSSELETPTPTNPEQAVATNAKADREVPVYKSDGQTQVGTFRIA